MPRSPTSAFPTVRSLPVLLGKGGYRTARIGKFHVAPEEVFKFEHAFPGNGNLSPFEEEVQRLRAENKRLLAERDILKKAAAFFAREAT